jgi:DHA2 family multidrug resistance protein
MARLTLEISPSSLLWPIVFSGMASGMVFVPLSTISVGTLKNEQIGNASGLFNLMRNVGGGIGISLVNTLVSRHSQIHRAELVQNLAPENPVFQQFYQSTERAMAPFASPNVAAQRAYGLIQGTLDAQSAAFAYVDVFRFLAFACFGCALVVFGMKRVRARKGAAAVAH